MGAEGAVEVVFRKEVQEAEDKAARRAELIEQYRATFSSPRMTVSVQVDLMIEGGGSHE